MEQAVQGGEKDEGGGGGWGVIMFCMLHICRRLLKSWFAHGDASRRHPPLNLAPLKHRGQIFLSFVVHGALSHCYRMKCADSVYRARTASAADTGSTPIIILVYTPAETIA